MLYVVAVMTICLNCLFMLIKQQQVSPSPYVGNFEASPHHHRSSVFAHTGQCLTLIELDIGVLEKAYAKLPILKATPITIWRHMHPLCQPLAITLAGHQ